MKQQYDQAIAEGERAVALDPNNADSYTYQANVLNSAGRPEEALRMVEQAMRLNPQFLLEVHRQRVPIKDPAVLERHLAALRKAGLK